MFTGIIEELGEILSLDQKGENLNLSVKAKMAAELKIDQSVSHNGICLTVVSLDKNNGSYKVTAVKETLKKTNLGDLKKGDLINLERGLRLGDRLDGHIVQGHVDQTARCTGVTKNDGSWLFSFQYEPSLQNITIEKGSITINGVSLTVINSKRNEFSVAIIPYTFENTTFKYLQVGMIVNLEFDVIGKYVQRITQINEN